jgi:hypothetical protein
VGRTREHRRKPQWATDPWGDHEHRYWDGDSWTDHVSDAGVRGFDPAELQQAPPTRRNRKIEEHLDAGEVLLASATFSVGEGSLAAVAFQRRAQPVVMMALTSHRLLMFATNHLAFNRPNLGAIVRSISLADIDRVDLSQFLVFAIRSLRLRLVLSDGSTFVFEAGRMYLGEANDLVWMIEQTIGPLDAEGGEVV